LGLTNKSALAADGNAEATPNDGDALDSTREMLTRLRYFRSALVNIFIFIAGSGE